MMCYYLNVRFQGQRVNEESTADRSLFPRVRIYLRKCVKAAVNHNVVLLAQHFYKLTEENLDKCQDI